MKTKLRKHKGISFGTDIKKEHADKLKKYCTILKYTRAQLIASMLKQFDPNKEIDLAIQRLQVLKRENIAEKSK